MPLLRHSFDAWNDRDEAAGGRRLLAPLVVTLRCLLRCPPASRRIIRLPRFAFRAYYAPKASAGTTTMDIGGWLRGLGLERYEQAFRDNEIDLRVLPELTADDLKELGVAAIGHRRLLLKAPADGDVLRLGRLDAAVDPLRSRGPARDRRCLPSLRDRHRRPLWRFCRQVYGRRRADLFRLSRGA